MSTQIKKSAPSPAAEKQKEIEYLNRPHQIFIHNVGHHDLYFDLYTLDGQSLGWHKPNSAGFLKLGNALQEAAKRTPDLFQLVTEYQGQKVGGYYELAQEVLVENDEITTSKTMGIWEWAESAQRNEDKHCSPLLKLEPKEIKLLVIKRLMMPLIDGALSKFENYDVRKFNQFKFFLVSSGKKNTKTSTHSLTEVLAKLTQLRLDNYKQNTETMIKEREKRAALKKARKLAKQQEELQAKQQEELQAKQQEELQIEKRQEQLFLVETHSIESSPHHVQASQLLTLEQKLRKYALEVADELEAKGESREDWSKNIAVHLSVNTGTPSMIAALTLALAEWSPFMHMIAKARKNLQNTPDEPTELYNANLYQVTSVSEWIEVDAQDLDQINQQAVEELRAWAKEYKNQRPIRPKDMDDKDERLFFHRKGLKEVLCVVVIQNPENSEKLEFIRGVNVEVSLPTGTLCAERNAISTAFCKFPQLERKNIKAVAVLSLDEKLSKLGPCGACQEWLKKVLEVNPDLRVIGFNNPNAEKVYVRPALMI